VVRASDDHQLPHQILLVARLQVNPVLLQFAECLVHNSDRTLDNERSGIDLRLSLLDLEETLSYLDVVSDLH